MNRANKAIDFDCQKCSARAGERCKTGSLCQERINTAIKKTRLYNQQLRHKRNKI